jgi:predicted nucleic acid-binding protein
VKAFIDTNVLVYWVDDSARADTVEKRLAGDSVTSVQVLNEFANVMRKKRGLSLGDIQTLCNTLIDTCEVYELNVRTHQTALAHMARCPFSWYDASTVDAAGLAGCAILYSEDMHNGLNVQFLASAERVTLSIRNPF